MNSEKDKILLSETKEVNNELEKVAYQAEQITELDNGPVKQTETQPNLNNNNISNAAIAGAAMNMVQNFIVNPNEKNNQNGLNKNSSESPIKERNLTINYSAVTNNPIEMFYNHINNTIGTVFDDYFAIKFNQYKGVVKKTYELDLQITDLEGSIISKKKELQYTKRKWIHALFIISFVFIIGLFFFKKYKANLAMINQFKEFKNQQENNILDTSNNRFALMHSLLSTITLYDLYKYTFERYGFKISELIPTTRILKLLDNKNNIDVKCGISGLYKNTPFYDVLVRSLAWREVTTSRSESFPYTSYETVTDSNGKRRTVAVTKYETLTAYHHENTPFIDADNVLVFMTHYEPQLLFSTNNKKPNKYIELENKNFVKLYGLDVSGDAKNDISIQQRVNQFFTIKAQEDYLKWLDLNGKYTFDFFKLKDSFNIFNTSHDIFPLEAANHFIEDINILENNAEVNLDVLCNRIKDIAFNYFNKIIKMLQLPLLSPAINREWYKHNSNNYTIGNNLSEVYDDVDNISNFDSNYNALRFLDPKFFWFNTNKKPTKPIWFRLNESVKNKKDIIHSHYNMNSYWSETLIDYVTVVGMHVGAKVIGVPYEKFYFFTEEKFLSNLFANNKNVPRIYITPNVRHLIGKGTYENQEFVNLMIQKGIWCSNPNWLENFSRIKQLVTISDKLNEYNKDAQSSIVIDQYGFYFISNNKDTKNEFVESVLLELKSIFSM